MFEDNEFSVMGWREWVSLPALGIEEIKAKVDTGARTSALHAFEISFFERNHQKMVKFLIHHHQYSTDHVVQCESPLYDVRWIADSSGKKVLRAVIKTDVRIGSLTWPIEISLTNRDDMRFRFLLGRSAIPKNILINTTRSYLLSKHLKN